MILFLFLAAGFIIGMFRGGVLGGLVRLRGIWLILISVLAERAIHYQPALWPAIFPAWLPVFQIARYLPLFLFALLNVKDWRVCLAGLGIAMNFAVIAMNNWQMPISPTALYAQDLVSKMPEYFIMTSYDGANLWYFSDIIRPFGLIYVSAGDIILGLGVMLSIQYNMANYKRGKHERHRTKLSNRMRHDDRPAPGAPSPEPLPVATDTMSTAEPEPAPSREEAARDLTLLQTSPVEKFIPQGEAGTPEQAHIPVRLSPRLETIARMAERGACVADVGCDHGKLAAWLALRGVPRVIAMDVSAKSLAKTRQLVDELELRGSVQTRVSDGLRKLKHGEADIIVMAGMGGPTICEILQAGHAKAQASDRLILQPMNAVGVVRQWLTDNGFRISDERLAEEDNRIYQILAAVPGDDPFPPMSLFDLEVGRLLVDCRHPLLFKLLANKMQTIDTILAEIACNATPKAEARRNELLGLRERCAEVSQWLAG